MSINRFATLLGKLALTLSVGFVFAESANNITDIEVTDLSVDKQLVKVTFSGEAAAPASFSVNTPPRIAFDFPEAGNQTGKNAVQVNGNVLRAVNIAEGNGRTRLMLSLQKKASYDAKIQGNQVLITVDGSGGVSASASSASTHFAVARATDRSDSVQSVDFRRGTSGEGKVIVDLSSPNVGIDIRQQGKNLVVDFAKASLPAKLEKRLDVTDFGTPVVKVETVRQGDGARMMIEPTGNWEYSAYQTENRFVVEVRNAVDEKGRAYKPVYKGEKLSLNFQNIEVRTVLQVIAEFTGLNIVTSDSVGGTLTLRLKEVPWDQALDIILQAKGLDQRKQGNVLRIAPIDELTSKEKQELEARKQISDLEPTRTEYFRLKYQKAEAFLKILKDDKQKLLSPRGSAVIDSRTNTLMVQDVPSRLEDLRELINKIDIPVKQVQIEARIVEATDGWARELGARWGLAFWNNRNGVSGLTGTRSNISNMYPTSGTGSSVAPDEYAVNLAANSLNGYSATSIAALFTAGNNNLITMELSALESDNKGKVLANPRLVTSDQVEAVIEQGEEIPYSVTAPNGATSVSFKKATLSLKVTPQITPDGNVMLDLKVNQDSRGTTTSAGPTINTKQITTNVLVENGGTVVVGGIYTQTLTTEVEKVPLLGDVPVLGRFFQHQGKEDTRKELLIFVTPRILQQEVSLR